MDENAVAKQVVDAAFVIHRDLGPGLFESVYQRVLAFELRKRGLRVAENVSMPIRYGELEIEDAFVADLVVEEIDLVELKSLEQLAPIHKKQLWTYLKLTNRQLGLLVNFGAEYIKHGIVRIVNGLPDPK